jgi:hypothetical protein
MDDSETEPERARQTPTFVWWLLALLVVLAFSVLALLIGRPSGGLPVADAPVGPAAQSGPVSVPKPTKLD